MSLYVDDLAIVSGTAHKYYKFICQMHLSFDKAELEACIADGKKKSEAPKFATFLQ